MQFNISNEEKMEKKRHEELAEEHLKNLSKESHTIISNQLNKTVLIDSEKEIIAKEQCIINKTLVGTYSWTKSAAKKLFIIYSGCFRSTSCIH